ncbi:hypothetical protein SAMN02745947_05417 [Rhodococcus rhodochrous J3]|uniref:Uncharacterized protein n=1 Tax=Rhodococcus rhodochrous J3 TaxID=903528 RepID=A0ABY1MIX7_RHORH|nr:hypothetical protein [Rhodococcus rhodochrous]MBF4478819.1 hypothetical protein [Rhodococcus rhodochrous]SMG59333.1 hypothetical protein SAMN02745947_05417 [Rhodococcus rhodochrous J3]
MPDMELEKKITALREIAHRLNDLATEAETQGAELSEGDNVTLSAAFKLLTRTINSAAITAESLIESSNSLQDA